MKKSKITIVGGGTAGLVSALILKTRFPYREVDIIKSKEIGIIGVGEGSTEHWKSFMQYCNINPIDLIKEADATIKLGVMFEDWTPKPYFHNITEYHMETFSQYLCVYGSNLLRNQIATTDPLHIKNELHLEDVNVEYPSQFHFNTFKLNIFLLKKCEQYDINIIEDEILDIEITNNNISKLIGEKTIYTSDFYIDSTGFKRLLISKLGAKWESYNKYLKLNEAIAFQTEDTDNYNVYTLAKAMKYGWFWRIPVYGRWGNGYIFDNNYITKDEAKQELERRLPKEIEIARHIKFDPGKVDKTWIGNCCAIGLSANFIEPLEATSIGTSINQSFLLAHYLHNYSELDIQDYNKKVNYIMENIRDFVCLHYMVKREDTEFWRDVKKINVPLSLQNNLFKWKNRLPIREDFEQTQYLLFWAPNFTSVLHGIGFWENNKLSVIEEYNSYNPEWSEKIRVAEYKRNNIFNNNRKTKHKDFLTYIRGQHEL